MPQIIVSHKENIAYIPSKGSCDILDLKDGKVMHFARSFNLHEKWEIGESSYPMKYLSLHRLLKVNPFRKKWKQYEIIHLIDDSLSKILTQYFLF